MSIQHGGLCNQVDPLFSLFSCSLCCRLRYSRKTPAAFSPAAIPLPLPQAAPMPPDALRANNPWNLSMTGPWRFQLTHGRIVANQFVSADVEAYGVSASSNEEQNPR